MEDAVCEIYEILCRDLKSAAVKNFSSWLFSVCRNHYLKTLNREPRHRFAEKELDFLSLVMENQQKEDLLLKESQLMHLEKALTELNEAQQRCLVAFYLEGKSYQEVVELTGFDMNKVKSHIQNGKRNLKIRIEEMSRTI
jgi:RNA polymerase sigma-70 factor (ECF subfamily)